MYIQKDTEGITPRTRNHPIYNKLSQSMTSLTPWYSASLDCDSIYFVYNTEAQSKELP